MLKSNSKEKQESCEACRSTGQRILKSIDSVSFGMYSVGVVAIVAMLVTTMVDVVLRWSASSTIGVMEITKFMLGLMVFFSFAWINCIDKHLKIEALTDHFPATARRVTDLLGAIVGFVFFGGLMLGSFGFAYDAYIMEEVTPILHIPLFPMKFIIMIASCLIFLQLLSSVIKRVIRLVKGK